MPYIFGVIVIALGLIFVIFIFNDTSGKTDGFYHESMVEACVTRLFEESEVMHSGTLSRKQYFVEFVDKFSKRMIFPISHKQFKTLTVGDSGMLSYQGYTFLRFIKEGQNSTISSQWIQAIERKVGKKCRFYAFAPSMNLLVSQENPVVIAVDQIKSYVDQMATSSSACSFGVEDDSGRAMHFSKMQSHRLFSMELPDVLLKGSYWLDEVPVIQVKQLIDMLVSKENISNAYQLQFVSWNSKVKERINF